MSADTYLAGIEAGGTKFICALATLSGEVLRQERIETTAPSETFQNISDFYAACRQDFGRIVGGGIGSFGPLDLDKTSATYGQLTTTPKEGWEGVNILQRLSKIIDAPATIDTDVTCAAMAEGLHGAATTLRHFCYMTVGTGIGVGVISNGQAAVGAGHFEIGHMRLPRVEGDEDFQGICPYHWDCAEGLASGPAMKARWGQEASSLPDDHPAWAMEAEYVAMLCANITYTLRPERIIIGGGVFNRPHLYALVRSAYREVTAGYALSQFETETERYICAPGLIDQPPGLIGALELAKQVAATRETA